jgi:OmpA-OmpF porin, OOP family
LKHFSYGLFLLLVELAPGGMLLRAQSGQPLPKLAADQAGCVDSKLFPKLLECRIDSCEKKDSDHRDVAVGEDEKGEAIVTSLEGNSRSVMYECREGTTPASVIEKAALALKTAGFDIPYRFAEAEASLTARKDDSWVTVDAASRFYTLTEITGVGPDFESVTDASSMSDMLERYGHVPVFGIQFLPGRADLTPESSTILEEVLTLMNDHPTWGLRVEGHTDSTGSKMANLTLSFRRASAVVSWLTNRGIKRIRLEPQGIGDVRPIGDNTTEAGRTKNRRIELVKTSALPGQ